MLKQKLILSYASQIFFQILQVVASLVVARIAGPTVLGTVAFGTAYVSVLSFVADLGLSTAHIKLVSEGRDFDRCLSTFTVLKLLSTLLFVLAVLAMYVVQKFALERSFESQIHEYVIFISLAGVTLSQLMFIPKTTFAARTEQAKIEMPNLLQGILLHPSRVVLVLLGFGAIALAFASFASFLLTIPFYLYLMRDYRLGSFDKKLAREYIVISLPIILIGMSTSVIHQIDKVLLQFFTSSEQVGYYTAGYKVGGFVLLIGKSVRTLFFPLFSKAVSEGNMGYIKDKIDKFQRFSFLFIMPSVLLLAIFSREIVLLLLGPEYLPSVVVMQVITVTMFIIILNMPFESVVEGLGKFRLSAILSTLNLVFFAGLIFVLVSPDLMNLGAAGVAFAIMISSIVVGSLYRYYATRSFPALEHAMALKFVGFGAVIFASFYYLFELLFSQDWLLMGVFVLLYLVTVYALYTLFNWMTKKDWGNLLSLIDLKSMKNYIVNEIRRK